MQKIFYGATYLDPDSQNFKPNRIMELEYYKVKNGDGYGIEILKRECANDIVNIEKSKIDFVATEENIVDHVLDKLKSNKVLPCTLDCIVNDLLQK